jgi:hypothetical protein
MLSLTTGLSHHEQLQVSPQWSPQWGPFLGVLGLEISAGLDAVAARRLMRRLGEGMAEQLPLPGSSVLLDLEAAMNSIWSRLHWGRVELNDAGQALQIVHHGAPLVAALGADSQAWAPALLEGVYEHWFRAAGAASRLRVRQVLELEPPEAFEPVHVFTFAV